MKFIEKLNNTSKVLLLIAYIVILAGVLLLAGSFKTNSAVYTDYSNIPGDENIDIAVRIKERRTLPSSVNEKESQYWDLQVYLHLKDQKAIYRNVTVYTAILKKDGTYKYEEKTASVLTGIENPNNITGSTSDRGIYSSYSATSKTMVYNSSTEEYTKKDGEPDKIFVKVAYEIKEEGKKEVKKSFTYQCDIINVDELDFDKFDSTTTNDSKNVVLAAQCAKSLGLKTIAMTGVHGGKLAEICDIVIAVPAAETYLVQEYHLPVYHAICAQVEETLFGEYESNA